jgi:segregation and condensation protein A
VRHGDSAPESNIVYDDTPIHIHMETIYRGLKDKGEMRLSELLLGGMHKSRVIGVFLAVLELVRHHSVEAEQEDGSVEIIVRPGPNFSDSLKLSDVDDYDGGQATAASA